MRGYKCGPCPPGYLGNGKHCKEEGKLKLVSVLMKIWVVGSGTLLSSLNAFKIFFQTFEFFIFAKKVSNGHSPQIRQNGELLVRMCRMRVTFWRMSANVSSVECIESREKGWQMSGECSESGLSRVANLANLANF